MFTRKYKFTIESFHFVDFMRLIGKFGLKFEVGNERCCIGRCGLTHYRDITVYATKKEIDRVYDTIEVLYNWLRN